MTNHVSVSVNLAILLDAAGQIDVLGVSPDIVSNTIVASVNIPADVLYRFNLDSLIQLYEPSDNLGVILAEFGNNYAARAADFANSLNSVINGEFSAINAAPFSSYLPYNIPPYYTFSSFGRLALSLAAHQLFGHVAATAAITNDDEFLAKMNSHITATPSSIIPSSDSYNYGDASGNALLALRLIQKFLYTANNIDPSTGISNLTRIARLIIGQDASRATDLDNNQLSPDTRQPLRFYSGDKIYLSITLADYNIIIGSGQLASQSNGSLGSISPVTYTLEITLSDPRPYTILNDYLSTPTILKSYLNSFSTNNPPSFSSVTLDNVNMTPLITASPSGIDTNATYTVNLLPLLNNSASFSTSSLTNDSLIYLPSLDGQTLSLTVDNVTYTILKSNSSIIVNNSTTYALGDLITLGNKSFVLTFFGSFTLGYFPPPPTPTLSSSVSESNSSLTLSYTAAPSNPSIDHFEYQYSVNNYSSPLFSTTSSPFTISGLTNGDSYSISIRSVSISGYSDFSNVVTASPGTTPSPPFIDYLQPSNSALSVYFLPPYNGGRSITAYRYATSTDNGSSWSSWSPNTSLSPASFTYNGVSYSQALLISGLTNGTSYSVKIRAVNFFGPSSDSNVLSATPATTPSKPIISLTAAESALTVSFSPPFDGGASISSYDYTYKPSSSSSFPPWTSLSLNSITVNGSTSSFSISSGLTNGTSYDVKLRAVNPIGTGAESDIATATPVTIVGTWPVSFGRNASNNSEGTATARDSYNNIYILVKKVSEPLYITDTKTISTVGTTSIVLLKYDSTGTLLWYTTVQGASSTTTIGYAVKVDSNNDLYISGDTTSTSLNIYNSTSLLYGTMNLSSAKMFIIKYNSSGNALWATNANGTLPIIALDASNNICLTGKTVTYTITINSYSGISGTTIQTTSAFTTTGSGSPWSGVFTAKFNSNGTALWLAKTDGSYSTYANAVTADASGNIYTSGYFLSNALYIYNSNGTMYDANGTAQGSLTRSDTSSYSYEDAYIIKYNSSGIVQWGKKIGRGSSHTHGDALVVDSSNNVYLSGYFISYFGSINDYITIEGINVFNTGGSSTFIVKYDTTGTMQWVAKTSANYVKCMIVDSANNMYISGGNDGNQNATINIYNAGTSTLAGTVSGTNYIAKYNPAGTLQWASSTVNIQCNGIFIDSANDIYTIGTTASTSQTINSASGTGPNKSYTTLCTTALFAFKSNSVGGLYATPTAPTISNVLAGDSQLYVIFTAPTSNGNLPITRYEYSINSGTSWTSVGLPSSGFFISGLINYTTYQVIIHAVNSLGASDSSTAVSGIPVPSATVTTSGAWPSKLLYTSTTAGKHIAIDTSGNICTITDTLLIKYSPSGSILWYTTIVNATNTRVRTDINNNIYVMGTNTSPLKIYSTNNAVLYSVLNPACTYLIKYNSDGVMQWAAPMTVTGGTYYDISIYNTTIYISGDFGSGTNLTADVYPYTYTGISGITVQFTLNNTAYHLTRTGTSKNNSDAFVIVYNTSGTVINAYKDTNLNSSTYGGFIASDASDNAYTAVSTNYVRKYTPTTGLITYITSTSIKYPGAIAVKKINNNVHLYMVGYFNTATFWGLTNPLGSGYDYPYLAYYVNGVGQWASLRGATSMDIDSSGNLYRIDSHSSYPISTNTSGGTRYTPGSYYAAKYNTSGTLQWLVGSNGGNFTGITIDSSGYIYISSSCAASDTSVQLYDNSGTLRTYPITNNGVAGAILIKLDSNGNILTT